MKMSWGMSWSEGNKGRAAAMALAALLVVSLAGPTQMQQAAEATERFVSVIVRELPGAGNAPERAVRAVGGEVQLRLGIIEGFSARVPRSSVHDLRAVPGVLTVTPNYRVRLMSTDDSDNGEPTSTATTTPASEYTDPNESGVQRGSMYELAKATQVRHFWQAGYTGQGVDVAVVDTGVSPVQGMATPGKVVMGPDLSFEAPAPNLYSYDTNGHGTHVSAIIAGKDPGTDTNNINDDVNFLGMAPDARIVPVKVANAAGATDVSQVLAAIHWVVQHRNSNGLNIKVMNLSFGTDGVQDYRTDPLTYAVEVAWRKGVTVVVAAGNQQFGSTALNNPAYDPYVIAVGANDTKGTPGTGDDVIPTWSARGDGVRNPDLVAPGKSVISLRVPNSFIDIEYGSTGRYGERFFKGSGTSQSAAVVSGAAALIHSQRPSITPDQVKALLMTTAQPLPDADSQAQGSGMIDLKKALREETPTSVQSYPLATGTGSLDAARGTLRVVDPDGNVLSGEMDIFGTEWSGSGWSADMWNGSGWSGGGWNGSGWSGSGWSGSGWSGSGWSDAGWSGSGWSGSGWSGSGWSGSGWSGSGWSGSGWSGSGWSGSGWSGSGWSGSGWSGSGWSGSGWSGSGWSGSGWSGSGWSGSGWS